MGNNQRIKNDFLFAPTCDANMNPMQDINTDETISKKIPLNLDLPNVHEGHLDMESSRTWQTENEYTGAKSLCETRKRD